MPPKKQFPPPTRPTRRMHFKRTYNAAPQQTCQRFMQLWHGGSTISEIAGTLRISESTGYRWQASLLDHGSIRPENQLPAGRRHSLTVADEIAVLERLQTSCWLYLDEIVAWLRIYRAVDVSASTVSRMFKRNGWTKKILEIGSAARSPMLRQDYLKEMQGYSADQLVFIDESIFNEKTGWRRRGRAPLGRPAKVRGNISRGKTWSILPAYTLDGYLPCTGIQQGYFNRVELLAWIEFQLLPAIAEKYPGETKVIVLDNVSIHTTDALAKLIYDADHVLKYLPPYSPDFNPIELTFAVLKTWMKRNYFHERGQYHTYGDYLSMALAESGCDRFAQKHFRHAAKGVYLPRDEWEALQERNRLADLGLLEDSDMEDGIDGINAIEAPFDTGNITEALFDDANGIDALFGDNESGENASIEDGDDA